MRKYIILLLIAASFGASAQVHQSVVAKRIYLNGNWLTDSETGDTIATVEWVNDTLSDYVLSGTLSANYWSGTRTDDSIAAAEARANTYTDSQVAAISKLDTVKNLGTGTDLITQSSDTILAKSLVGTGKVTISSNTTDVTIDVDSTYNTVSTDNLEGNASDTIEVNDNVDFNEGIRLRVDTISFSVSMTFDFTGQTTTQVINMTNNADLDITVPKGGFYEIEVYQDATGGRTLTVDGASKATNSGDQSTDASAVSLYQFRHFVNDSVFYWIDSPY